MKTTEQRPSECKYCNADGIATADAEPVQHNLTIWSWYVRGALDMLRRLREDMRLAEPHQVKYDNQMRIVNKAVLDLIQSSKEDAYRYLIGGYEIRLTDWIKDKRGRHQSCRAYFVWPKEN